MRKKSLAVFLIPFIFLSSCAPQAESSDSSVSSPTQVQVEAAISTSAVVQNQETTPTVAPASLSDLNFWIEPSVPAQLANSLGSISIAPEESSANLRLGLISDQEPGVVWIYALATPFSSLLDEMSLSALKSAWKGTSDPSYDIYLEESTLAALEDVLGQPGANVMTLEADDIIAASWEDENTLAILPFEALEPRWKIIAIDGQSPIHNDFESDAYPLKATFGWQGDSVMMSVLSQAVDKDEFIQIAGNRDPTQLTVLVMTGVTALVRATAVKMEEKGMTYPGEAVRDWLVNADLTHISNEVSFSPVCPDPVSYPGALIFCSKPEYIELLDYVGTDILELTGNHGIDWGRDALTYSLGLYEDRGWLVYASGESAAQAREAVTVEHNGNRLAFIGCNPAGPEFIWATETQSGVANCDYPWMWQRIRQLTDEGYQVISTFQYFETYRHYVEPFEERDFRSMADAGAVIVSGSQAHHPMAMEFYDGSFIHYGLGNLFFDQMHTGGLIPDATRKEFIDRHVFYNNRHISTELLTAMLEDYARPRPMSPAERFDFLTEIFAVTDWGDVPWIYKEK